MSGPMEEWAAVLDRVVASDRAALVQLGRLIASFLVRWRAQDLRDDWDDIVQETVANVVRAAQRGKLRDRQAAAAYIKTTARRSFIDCLRRRMKTHDSDVLPWEEVVDREAAAPGAPKPASLELRRALDTALARLPHRQRDSVVAVYVEGRTSSQGKEVAEPSGIEPPTGHVLGFVGVRSSSRPGRRVAPPVAPRAKGGGGKRGSRGAHG